MTAKEERSAGFIIHRLIDGTAGRYLLLDYGGHWDFAKGHVEPGEDDLAAAHRELREETGLTHIERVTDFCRQIDYYFQDRRRRLLVHKVVVFYLARTTSPEIILSHEHVGYAYLPFEAASKQLTYANAREVLRLAHERLTM